MGILSTPTGQDVLRIIESGDNGTGTVEYQLELFTKAGLAIPSLSVAAVHLDRDLNDGTCDQLTVVCTISRAYYENLIYPNRKDLRAVFKVIGAGNNVDVSGAATENTYRAYLFNPKDEGLLYGNFTGDSLDAKDQNMMDFAIRIEDLDYINLANANVSGVVYEATVEDIVTALCSNQGEVKVAMFPPERTEAIPHLPIPDGTPLLELANWIQKFGGGIYSAGINTYFLNDWLHIYPNRLMGNMEGRPRVVILRVGPDELLGVESTYAVKDNTIYILSTGQADYADDTERYEKLVGNAVRFSKPTYQDGRVVHKDGRTEFHNTDYQVVAQTERRSNHSKVHNLNTDNPYYEASRLNATVGKKLELTWANCNSNIIVPNMEVEVHYISNGEAMSVAGIIEGFKMSSERDTARAGKSLHRSTGLLRIRLQP